MIDPILSLACALFLAWLFLAAGAHKLRDPAAFGAIVSAYRLLPETLARPAARALPVLEIALAVGLLAPAARHAAGTLAAVLLGMYTTAIAMNLLRGRRNIDCGCGDPNRSQSLGEWLLLRNGILVLAALAAGAPAARAMGVADAVVAFLAATAAALIYSACNQLLGNRAQLANLRSSHG